MNSFLDAKIQGIANDGMADTNLRGPREGLDEGLEVLEVQVMTRIHTETQLVRFLCCRSIFLDSTLRIGRKQLGVRTCVQFHAV